MNIPAAGKSGGIAEVIKEHNHIEEYNYNAHLLEDSTDPAAKLLKST